MTMSCPPESVGHLRVAVEWRWHWILHVGVPSVIPLSGWMKVVSEIKSCGAVNGRRRMGQGEIIGN